MIRSLRIRHFKAIRDSRQIRLKGLNVFVGNNGAGKSSLIEGLEVLSSLRTYPRFDPFERFRGFQNAYNKAAGLKLATVHLPEVGKAQYPFIGFELDAKAADTKFAQHLKLEIGLYGDELVAFDGLVKYGETALEFNLFSRASADQLLPLVNGGASGHSHLGFFAFGLDGPPDLVEPIQFLRMDGFMMGEPRVFLPTNQHNLLDPEGKNLGQYLSDLLTSSPEVFQDLVESLSGFVLPYAQDLNVNILTEIQKSVYLTLDEGGFKVPGWLLSSGTLRLIALMAVLRNPKGPRVVCMEELENGLDPRTIVFVMQEIRQFIKRGGQVLLTTHSPYLLDQVNPDEIIIVVRNDQGEPIFKQLKATAELKQYAERFSTGDLYTMGVIADYAE